MIAITKMRVAYVLIFLTAIALIVFTASQVHAWKGGCYNDCGEVSPIPTPTETASPTPTPTPTPSPSESPNPCGGIILEESWNEYPTPTPCPTETPKPTPTPSPSETPTPTSTPQPTDNPGTSSPSGPFPAPASPVCQKIEFKPTVTVFSVNPTPLSIHVEWSKVDGFVQDYEVWYGLTPDASNWNTLVKGDTKTDLSYLPAGRSIWVKVRGTANGCVGDFGPSKDPWPTQPK